MERRSPSGERGLKYAAKYHRQAPNPRRSPSGERGLKYIGTDPIFRPNHGCSPSGERGLKYQFVKISVVEFGRSPSGERGLKLPQPRFEPGPAAQSLPIRGAWIEINCPTMSAKRRESLPIRGAWIEIVFRCDILDTCIVAPHPGSVD